MPNSPISYLQETPSFQPSPFLFGASTLEVIHSKGLMVICYSADSRKQLSDQIGAIPEPGRSEKSSLGGHLLWTGERELFFFNEDSSVTEEALAQTLGSAGYATDVSDGWVALRLEGADALHCLDQITMPDLNSVTFETGHVTSTVYDHMRVVIWRQSADRIIILSPASSGKSLLHRLSEDLNQSSIRLNRR